MRPPRRIARTFTFILLAAAVVAVTLLHRVPYAFPPNYKTEIEWIATCIPKAAQCGSVEVLGLAPDVVCSAVVASFVDGSPAAPPKRGRVPHIIHQSWKTEELPAKFALWASSWRRTHSSWQYRLWTDSDNDLLVASKFPWLRHCYERLPTNIQRADLSRYLYMHEFGGVYADLDTWCLRSNGNITRRGGIVVAEMGSDKGMGHNVPNAWMASAAGHPFWLFLSRMILHRSYAHNGRRPEDATGPVILKQALEMWICMGTTKDVVVLPPGYVFIKDWHDGSDWARLHAACDPETIHEAGSDARCLADYPNAHVLTYWSHTWERKRAE